MIRVLRMRAGLKERDTENLSVIGLGICLDNRVCLRLGLKTNEYCCFAALYASSNVKLVPS